MTLQKARAAHSGEARALAERSRAERRLERRREARRAELAMLERDRAEIFSALANDLRNPLTAVVWSIEMLARRIDPDDSSRRLLDIATRTTEEMDLMLQDLIDAALILDGRLPMSLVLEPYEPAALVEQAAASVRIPPWSKTLTITLDVSAGLPPIVCDRERIARVVGGLLANVVRRTPRGGTVSARASRLAKGGRDALRIVMEGGQAIDPHGRATLFSLPAAPAPGAPRRAPTMSRAIALFVARGIVEAHGGKLDLEGERGPSARFVLTLPLSAVLRQGEDRRSDQ
jgi:signal transduction histidine kinase